MQKLAHQIYSFDEFRLDLTRGSLFRHEVELKLRPKSFDVLKYFAENSGRLISKDELIEAVWQGTAVTDDSLVQCLKDIRQALDDRSQTIIKTVPRRGYIFEKEVSENVGGVYLEETSGIHLVIEETIKTNGNEDAPAVTAFTPSLESSVINRVVAAARANRIVSLSVAALVTVITLTAILYKPIMSWYFKPPSIAVLPITNSTGKPELEYLSEGMTDSIIHSLAQLNESGRRPRLRVTALNTVFVFKDATADPRETGQKLGVDSVLASKMSDENGLRYFKFELIDVTDGSVRWSNQYSYSTARPVEVLEAQNAIPRDVAAQLPIDLSDADRQILTRRYTQNAEAYDEYLRGRAAARLVTPSSLRKSIQNFRRAIDLDPNFALAHWAMGTSYRTEGLIDEIPDREANERAVDLFQRALKIDSTLTVANDAIKANEGAAGNWEPIKKAGPSHPGYAQYLAAAGRIDELLEDQKQRLTLSPYVPILNFSHCETLLAARHYPDAIAQCKKTLDLAPSSDAANFGRSSPWTHLLLANIYGEEGRFDDAVAEAKRAVDLSERSAAMLAMLACMYAEAGRKDEALGILDSLQKQLEKGEYVPPLNVAWVYGYLGDRDTAFTWLERAFQEQETRLNTIKSAPAFDPLRSDPRFATFVQRLALPD
jgi:DNA-binding winged helix-turn-helix (wHTH) protein/TolB-like protein/Tfp pilus assembly protein PilF